MMEVGGCVDMYRRSSDTIAWLCVSVCACGCVGLSVCLCMYLSSQEYNPIWLKVCLGSRPSLHGNESNRRL